MLENGDCGGFTGLLYVSHYLYVHDCFSKFVFVYYGLGEIVNFLVRGKEVDCSDLKNISRSADPFRVEKHKPLAQVSNVT
jgi:hypothetical protein